MLYYWQSSFHTVLENYPLLDCYHPWLIHCLYYCATFRYLIGVKKPPRRISKTPERYLISFLKAINVQTSKMGFGFQFHTNLTKDSPTVVLPSLTSFQEYLALPSFCSFSPIDFKLSLENELIFITKLHSFLMRRLWVDRTSTTIGHKIAGIYDCDRMEMSSFSFSIFRDFSVFFGFQDFPQVCFRTFRKFKFQWFLWIERKRDITSHHLRKMWKTWLTNFSICCYFEWITCQFQRRFTWNC